MQSDILAAVIIFLQFCEGKNKQTCAEIWNRMIDLFCYHYDWIVQSEDMCVQW